MKVITFITRSRNLWILIAEVILLITIISPRACNAFHRHCDAAFVQRFHTKATSTTHHRLRDHNSHSSLLFDYKRRNPGVVFLGIRRPIRPWQEWEGDDIRWSSKMRRYFRRLRRSSDSTPARTSLILVNVLVFLFQIVTTVDYIGKRNPSYWPSQAIPMTLDTLMGSSILGPFTKDFVYSNALCHRQPHRFLSSGFLHGSILHLVLNMDSLSRTPPWLETGLGKPLFLTTFLVSIVTGNLGHTFLATESMFDRTMCLGASGGVCGLYGLLFVQLVKMRNKQAASRIAKGMGLLFLYGFFIEQISNSGHIGGFVGGLLLGIICGPGYTKDYRMRRKNSLDVDIYPRGYRQAMGFGVSPTSQGLLPLRLVWAVVAAVLLIDPNYRTIPFMIWKGIANPGALYATA